MHRAVQYPLLLQRRNRRFFSAALFATALFLGFAIQIPFAYAGFGITPPYVRSDRLTRGSEYKQQINLVRSDPQEDLKVEITLNIPDAQAWFTVDKGTEFVIPKGVTQMPILVTVHVPDKAEYKQYKGAIRIRTSTVNAPAGGGVSIALGAQADVDIKVVDKIFDFTVRQIKVADSEEGKMKWGLFFPGKIRFFMTIQNTGNVEYGPTRVTFDIYDSVAEQLLEKTSNTNKLEKITPFSTKEIVAELPTRLGAGSYAVKYTIFKGKEVAQQGQINLSIAAIGAVPGYEGYGFEGLSLTDKLKVAAAFGVPVILLLVFVLALLSYRKRRSRKKKGNGYSSR